MKKRILLLTLIVGSYIGFNSFINGSAANGYDHTGAETSFGNTAGCGSSGTSCHGPSGSAGINLEIRVDSVGLWVDRYVAGVTYTVTVTAKNTLLFTHLPKFGFQAGVIKGTVPGVVPINAGVLQSSGLPTGVSYYPAAANYLVNLVESNMAMPSSTGMGDTGSTYTTQFRWTAPAPRTGKVSIWASLAAVNNNGVQDIGDRWATTHKELTELYDYTAVGEVNSSLGVSVYPNPVADQLNILFSNAASGEYTIGVYDLAGRLVTSRAAEISGASASVAIDTRNWAPGLYIAVAERDGVRQSIQITKN